MRKWCLCIACLGALLVACNKTPAEVPKHPYTQEELVKAHLDEFFSAIATDENLDGYTEIFLFSTQRLMDYIFQSNIRQGDKLWIKLCTMDRKSYDYWSNFDATLTGNMINMPSARSVLDNMVQGASGY